MKAIHSIKSSLFILAIATLLQGMSPSWAEETAPADGPDEVIRNLQSILLQSMREGEELGFQGRYDLLAPVLNQSHNFKFIIRTILGTYWTEFNQDQQREISEIFNRLSIATYASQFKAYSGEQFEILENRPFPQNHIEVRTQLIKSNKNTVDLRYLLRQEDMGWRIVNIVAKGVSELAIKRTEYRSILQRDGYHALIEMLKEKIIEAEQI